MEDVYHKTINSNGPNLPMFGSGHRSIQTRRPAGAKRLEKKSLACRRAASRGDPSHSSLQTTPSSVSPLLPRLAPRCKPAAKIAAARSLSPPPAMSDARGGAAGPDREGDDPHAEEEAVPVVEAETAAPAQGGSTPLDAEPESDGGEGEGSLDREEANAVPSGGGDCVMVANDYEEQEGVVGGAKVETNGEDAISHDGDGEGDEDEDGGDEEEDDDDDSTPDASPRAEVKVEGESSTGMAQSEASHRVETDPFLDSYDSGTEEEQAAFMAELERFHREHGLEFKPPKFYGKGLNCLKCASFSLSRLFVSEILQLYANISFHLNLLVLSKSRLWRQVAHLGGHDQVRQISVFSQALRTVHTTE
jgi:hypothetical protein